MSPKATSADRRLPLNKKPTQIVSGVASRPRASDVPVDRLEHALAGPEPATDQQLVELGRELESIAQQIEGATR